MRRIVTATMVCAVVLATMVSAEEAQRRALAEELVGLMGIQKNIEKSVELATQAVSSQLAQMGTPKDASSLQKMMDLVMEEINWDTVKNDHVSIFADIFTEEELRDLVSFYKSPTGRKFIEKQPELMKQTTQVSQKHMMEIMPKIQALAQELMKQETTQPQDSSDEQ